MTLEEANELERLRTDRRSHGCSNTKEKEIANDNEGEGNGGFKRRTWVLFSIMGGLIYGYNVRYVFTQLL